MIYLPLILYSLILAILAGYNWYIKKLKNEDDGSTDKMSRSAKPSTDTTSTSSGIQPGNTNNGKHGREKRLTDYNCMQPLSFTEAEVRRGEVSTSALPVAEKRRINKAYRGPRPVCAQCLEHNRPCQWPEKLKRGPAKGYIEVLENRLHETETVLLGVLSQISDTQLASTFARDESSSGYTPFPPEKRGVEYWKRFPLDTASSVREWQQDCMPDRQQHQHQQEHLNQNQQQKQAPSQGLEVEPPSPPRQLIGHMNPSDASSPETRSPSQRAHRQHTSQEPSSWTGAPPARFQEQFLW